MPKKSKSQSEPSRCPLCDEELGDGEEDFIAYDAKPGQFSVSIHKSKCKQPGHEHDSIAMCTAHLPLEEGEEYEVTIDYYSLHEALFIGSQLIRAVLDQMPELYPMLELKNKDPALLPKDFRDAFALYSSMRKDCLKQVEVRLARLEIMLNKEAPPP